MANTTRITTIQRHLGTAAERAAMSTTGLPIGSTFEETDTKLVYIWDPVTAAWYLEPGISATVDDLTILGPRPPTAIGGQFPQVLSKPIPGIFAPQPDIPPAVDGCVVPNVLGKVETLSQNPLGLAQKLVLAR